MTIKQGKQFYNLADQSRKSSNKILSGGQNKLKSVNNAATKNAIKAYKEFLNRLEKDDEDKLINKPTNTAKIRTFLNKLEKKIFGQYKAKYSKISIKTAKNVLKHEQKFLNQRNKLFELEAKQIFTKEFNKRLDKINKKSFQRINQTIKKWHNFAYRSILRGITQKQTPEEVIKNLITPSGSSRIGSSFSQATEAEIIINAVTQRTAFVMEDAKLQDLRCCWNANPIDPRTKQICLEASMAGVIPEKEMIDVYGPPPRYICRCDFVYTRCEWTSVNRGINQAIEERRVKLIDIMKADPNSYQKSSWLVSMGPGKRKKRVIPDDPTRAKGQLLYKDTEQMIELLETSEVPEY
jgi:hypothetical protein